jgi:branched-chain amino acid transport system permease protein
VSLSIFAEQLLDAAALSALLFLVSVGLSLIFGILGVVNFAHGVFYMLGAYAAFTLATATGSFWVALAAAPPLVGVLGGLLEASTLRFIYRRPPIYQLLLTFGLAMVLAEGVRMGWGAIAKPVDPPAVLAGSVEILGAVYPRYRLFLIAAGVAVGRGLWLFLTRTRAGLVLRAVAQNGDMVGCLGGDVQRVRTLAFGAACALAALGGVIAAPMTTAYLDMGISVIVDAFVVVVIGGLGSIVGSMAGSLIVGAAQTWGGFYVSEAAMAIMYVVMAAVILFRPRGLFGEED